MVQLTDEMNAELDREAIQRRCSRSAIIRQAITDHLDRTSLQRDITDYVTAYQRTPQGARDVWGAVASAEDSDGKALAFSLDAEDAAAGFSWDDHA